VREALQTKRAAEVRDLFGRIAPRYDLLNRLLSLGQDVRWRRRVARRVAEQRPRRVLDICTGTGDLALAFDPNVTTFGSDYCLPMLLRANHKARRRRGGLPLFAADALQMPVRDGCVDMASVAFGIRNFEDLEAGLRELARVLRPGGRLLVLEFSRPRGVFAPLLGWWVRHIPPRVGRLVSGDREAYGYLTASVATFPDGDELCGLLERVGVRPTAPRRLTGGVATLYEAVKVSAGDGEEER
jgi:demethylmenaquinone methyltransferase/2-methoxy-6-polyprenyl-1,4-benzoquinol methylase